MGLFVLSIVCFCEWVVLIWSKWEEREEEKIWNKVKSIIIIILVGIVVVVICYDYKFDVNNDLDWFYVGMFDSFMFNG